MYIVISRLKLNYNWKYFLKKEKKIELFSTITHNEVSTGNLQTLKGNHRQFANCSESKPRNVAIYGFKPQMKLF